MGSVLVSLGLLLLISLSLEQPPHPTPPRRELLDTHPASPVDIGFCG